MSGHTPGPWFPTRMHEYVVDGEVRRYYEPYDEAESLYLDSKPFVGIESATGKTVTNAHDLFKFKSEDARLIAAAPDLLKAAQRVSAIGDCYWESEYLEATDELDRAIAKALGERE